MIYCISQLVVARIAGLEVSQRLSLYARKRLASANCDTSGESEVTVQETLGRLVRRYLVHVTRHVKILAPDASGASVLMGTALASSGEFTAGVDVYLPETDRRHFWTVRGRKRLHETDRILSGWRRPLVREGS